MEYTIHLTRVYRGKTIHTTKLCCEARKHSLNCSNINHTGVTKRSRTINEHMRGRDETRNPTAPVLETTHNTQRATHNYSRAAKVLMFLGRGTSTWASRLILIVVYVRLSCVCLWAEWPLAYFSTAAYLYSICVSSPVMTSIRLFILLSRCFSKIIIFFFFFSSHSPNEVFWVDFLLLAIVLFLYFSDHLSTCHEYCRCPRCSGSSIIADDIYFIPAMSVPIYSSYWQSGNPW